MKPSGLLLCVFLFSLLLAERSLAQRGQGQGPGFRGGRGANEAAHHPGHDPIFPQSPGGGHGPGGGHAQDERHQEDHEVLQYLLANHEKIRRSVTETPSGVESLTESDDVDVADRIKEHVQWMQYRVENTHPIRMRDPLFAELFKHTEKIKMVFEKTEKGVKVTETSDDPYVAKLIQAHAKVVSGFVDRGFTEAMKNHAVPGTSQSPLESIQPAIAGYGAVVPLPNAAHQPRPNTRIVVDLTGGGDPETLYPSIEKIARYVNIYQGAGKEPADAQIAVVLHGDATLAVLNADAYSKKYGTDGNPNLDCLHKLHEAGVELYVCGQSLIGKGGKPEEVALFVDVAVSALTSLVNLQADGFSYIPLK